MNKKLVLFSVGVILFVSLIGFFFREKLARLAFLPRNVQEHIGVKTEDFSDIEIIASGLEIPWEIAFLPSGEMLVTERPGRVVKIGKERKVTEIAGVAHVGEGGLLGMALDPDFERNAYVYLYLTTNQGDGLINRVERYVLEGDFLVSPEVILDGIPGSRFHDGGRIAFGPDGYLYITTGDAGERAAAQDAQVWHGKILRISTDGSIPADNPFGNEVYSLGHRNPQGLAWTETGELWITEHGPSGLESGFDELNIIQPGQNYGWPTLQGEESAPGMVSPIIQSGSDDTWAPGGMAFWKGSLFFAGLRGEALYEYVQQTGELKAHFQGEFGRLRTIVLGPDGFLYLTTSNRDGRGEPQEGDDKIIRIHPKGLQTSNFSARFEIYTRGTERSFSQAMYHRQSPEVFIESSDPGKVQVRKQGVTWGDFFETLPMSLTSECLVTGTQQSFCSNDTETLRFFLNETESPNALNQAIKPGDFLRVAYE